MTVPITFAVGPNKTGFMVVPTVLPASAAQRPSSEPHPHSAAEPIGIAKRDSLANYSERELPPYAELGDGRDAQRKSHG
jgi:hypothetical protein